MTRKTLGKKRKKEKKSIFRKESQGTERFQDSPGILRQPQNCISHKQFQLFLNFHILRALLFAKLERWSVFLISIGTTSNYSISLTRVACLNKQKQVNAQMAGFQWTSYIIMVITAQRLQLPTSYSIKHIKAWTQQQKCCNKTTTALHRLKKKNQIKNERYRCHVVKGSNKSAIL